jgi:putative transposase
VPRAERHEAQVGYTVGRTSGRRKVRADGPIVLIIPNSWQRLAELQVIRKPETVAFWRGRLPHWEVVDGRYFITMHLKGAIPLHGQERINEMAMELSNHCQNADEKALRIQRRIFAEMEAWLDRTPYRNHLQNPGIAEMVMEAIASRAGKVWKVLEYVIMPSHLHLFVELFEPGLKRQLEQFKRWTGHEAVGLLGPVGQGFWQDEWFDHWSRSDEQDEQIIEYIRQNPVKAGIVKDYMQWPYGGWRIPCG